MADPSTEFTFYLAAKLGRSVAELEAAMSNAEFIGWYTYFAKQAQAQELEMLKARGGSTYG